MQHSTWRLYLDTSVFGGCFDPEFAEESRRLVNAILAGHIHLVYSEFVESELLNAPQFVRKLFLDIPNDAKSRIALTAEIETLARTYIRHGVVTSKWLEDCRHVAAATVARADAIISWNFKHIVKLDKIKAYNQVNLLNGYGILTILSPKEVDCDE
jgi:predicted nucleic acid-binding protein